MTDMIRYVSRKLLLCVAVVFALTNVACAVGIDAGAALRNTEQELMQKYIERETERRLTNPTKGLDINAPQQTTTPEVELKVRINKIEHNPSRVLKDEWLKPIFAKYEGRENTLQELYAMVDEINALYSSKGYLTCKAFLLPQKLDGGVLNVRLVEGFTDNVTLKGNKTTKDRYVLNSLRLKKGDIANFLDLNDDILRYNMLNDTQLQIQVEPGKQPGSTQYVLVLKEPNHFTGTAFMDNAGSENSGEMRYGFSVTDRSFNGWRDWLTLSGVFSRRSHSSYSAAGYLNYGGRIGRTGALLSLSLSANDLKTDYRSDIAVRSEAQSVGLRYEYPWRADGIRRYQVFASMNHRWNRTLNSIFESNRKKIFGMSAGFDMLTYGTGSAFYHSHTLNYNHSKDELADYYTGSYWTYQLFSLFQYVTNKQNHMLTAKLNMTVLLADQDGANSTADYFYLGGPSSVRGYQKDALSAENGFVLNLDYAVPINRSKKFPLKAYAFCDYGRTWGTTYLDQRYLASLGLGLRCAANDWAAANLSLGFPLTKMAGAEEADTCRLDFVLSMTL